MTIATDCLAISELLKNIFDLLKPSERRRSLCSVALTCRTLSEPALDELWDTLPGLWPLLELFPDDVIAKEKQVQEDRGIHRHFALVQQPCPMHWDAFTKYSHRVHSLTVADLCDDELKVLNTLGLFRDTLALTPRLRCLYWKDWKGQKDSSVYANLFITSNLRVFHSVWSTAAISAIVARLVHSCPTLEDLWIESSWYNSIPFPTFTPTNLLMLKSLTFSGGSTSISAEMLLLLGHLPSLESLHVRFATSTPGVIHLTQSKDTLGQLLFPALKILYASASEPQSIPSALLWGAGHAPALTDLTVRIRSVTEHWLGQFFQSLCKHAVTLTSLKVFATGIDAKITLGTIGPVWILRNLSSLTLEVSGTFDDDFICAVARAFPAITALALGKGQFDMDDDIVATLDGLVHLAVHCPLLERLHLNFDTREVAVSWDTRPGAGNTCPRLRSLAVGNSRIDNPPAVAAFLSDIFPSMRVSEFDDQDDLDVREELAGWWEVERLLPFFRATRQQERRNASSIGPADLLDERGHD